MNYYDPEARWLDGPSVYAWLYPQAPGACGRERGWIANLTRRMNAWRNGAVVDVYVLDRYLCLLDIHASEIPDECWIERGPDRGKWAREAA